MRRLTETEQACSHLSAGSNPTEELDLGAKHGTDLDVAALWAAVEEAVPRTAVAGAVATVEALVPENDGSSEAAMWEKLALRYAPSPDRSTPLRSTPAKPAGRTAKSCWSTRPCFLDQLVRLQTIYSADCRPRPG